jgi:putative N6-adenine-specific DNA methylase
MAGSGTFSLEAAYMANKFIPGKCRDFALKHQPAFKEATWNYIVRQENSNSVILSVAPQGAKSKNLNIVTSDISERAIEIIKHNVESSPLASISPNGDTPTINPQLKDFFAYTTKEIADASKDASPIIVLNPPYGKRLDFDAPKLYTKIGRKLTELAHNLKQFNKTLTVAILAPKDDRREGSKYTCTSNLLRECAALSPEHNSAAKLIATSHGGFSLNVFIAQLNY